MSRAAFQVLVLPFRRRPDGAVRYAIFRRADADYWQFIAGGGEDGEEPLDAARREVWEEAGISPDCLFMPLDSVSTAPVVAVTGEFTWGEEVYVIPEHTFAVEAPNAELDISGEHTQYRWLSYDDAVSLLKWDSNKNALWELHVRLARQGAS